MKIHSNILEKEHLRDCLPDPHIHAEIAAHGSRKRMKGYDVWLEWLGPRHKGDGRKLRNSGNEGAKQGTVTATYDEHGLWMAKLFEIDPIAIISFYDGVVDFNNKTNGAFSKDPSIA